MMDHAASAHLHGTVKREQVGETHDSDTKSATSLDREVSVTDH